MVSSYTSTIRALGYARDLRERATGPQGPPLIVAMPTTPGGAPLTSAEEEVAIFLDRFPQAAALVGPCPCRKPRPCRSCDMLVLVEDAAESVAFSYVEAGDLPWIGDRNGQRL